MKKCFFINSDLRFGFSSPKNIGKDILHEKFDEKMTKYRIFFRPKIAKNLK